SNEQQLLGIGWQTQVRGRLTLWQLVNPTHKVLQTGARWHKKATIRSVHELVIHIVGIRGQELRDKLSKLLEIALVVNLASVRLGNQVADHIPRDILRRNVGSVACHTLKPRVENKR